MKPLPGALLLIGHPVAHSPSPAFQTAALRAAGIPLEYVARDVPPQWLQTTLDDIRATRAAGNVTVPHKFRVHEACDELTPTATRAGAVNAFRVDDGRLIGHNTDVGGVDCAVRKLLGDPRGKIIALIGAGGAAAAVLVAASSWESEVRVRSRSYEHTKALTERVYPDAHVVRRVDDAVDGADLVINATTLGMREDDELPCDLDDLDPGAAVFDLVYGRNKTRWVREARARGHEAMDGREMLLEQGALAFEWWLGIAPDRGVMRAALTPR